MQISYLPGNLPGTAVPVEESLGPAYRILWISVREQMLWGQTFVFGDIGLRRKNLKKPIKPKKPKNL